MKAALHPQISQRATAPSNHVAMADPTKKPRKDANSNMRLFKQGKPLGAKIFRVRKTVRLLTSDMRRLPVAQTLLDCVRVRTVS